MEVKLLQQAKQALNQMQSLMMTPSMQKALHLLQLPILEMSALLEEEIEKNPLLELIDHSSSFYFPDKQPSKPSFYEPLFSQAREFFNGNDLEIANEIIGNIELSGFLTTPLEELAKNKNCDVKVVEKVLIQIQSFEPIGVGSRSRQEYLLIQLKKRQRENSLTHSIVKNSYHYLLKNQLFKIVNNHNCTLNDVKAALDEIKSLYFSFSFDLEIPSFIVPDLIVKDKKVFLNEDPIPQFGLQQKYLNLLRAQEIKTDTRRYILQNMKKGYWLLKGIITRHETLINVGDLILQKQKLFFTDNVLVPMTMQEIANELNLNVSTISRAVSNKFIACDFGLFPLRKFFNSGSLPAPKIKETISEIIAHEDRKDPLSDQDISLLLKNKGILCSRRVTTKYRNQLGIQSASKRKLF